VGFPDHLRHSGAGRVEAGRAGVDDLDEAVPPGPEAGQVRGGGRKEEQVGAGPRQRDAIRIALARAGLKAGVSNGAISLQNIHSRADLSVLITFSEKRLFSFPF